MITLFKLIFWSMLAMLPQQEPLGEYWGTGEEESKYYKLVDIPLPKELAVEAGSFEVMPDQEQLAIATRRGDIFLVEGAFDEHPEPTFKKFASGLDEIFGMAYRDGSFHVTQQTEVTRITDVDGDGRGDRFDTLSDVWGFRHYHEFAFGSKPDADGNIWVALCLSKSYHSDAPFRGWCLKITPDGEKIPVCSGIRSPCGIGPNEHGVMFYAESQGPWNGSCSLKVLQPGGFMGHPVSFNWYELAPELGPAPVVPNTPSRLEVERKRVKELVPYAVVFPYKRMGRSISGFMVDQTGGKFGPFENQMFVADFSLGVVMRATTEQVNGVWQGACYPFREGFDTGLLAVQFTPNGSLIAGGTNRGWPVRGPKAYAVQRLDWTGLVPFEIKEINATPQGFDISFTKPVMRQIASTPETYQLKTFTHLYRQGYGSPEVDQTTPVASKATVSADGLRVNVEVENRVQGHVHDFHLPDMRSAEDEELLHSSAYYTLNEIPNEIPKPAIDPEKRKANKSARAFRRRTDFRNRGLTQGIIDFKRPETAEQLVGDDESKFVPENLDKKSLWEFNGGVLTASPKGDSVVTPDSYQDFRMHVEFNVNDAGDVAIARDGNSGVYLQQRYEIQILNSFGIPADEYKANYCGSLYRQKKPDYLANKPAGEWQSFDIAFRAARFDGERKAQNARITVYQNGQLIHEDHAIQRKTGAGKKEGPDAMPVKLQGHGNQVRFRNVWIQKLALPDPEPEDEQWLTFPGAKGPGAGKHVVLIAAEQEYRSEQALPMLAQVLAERHGFDCTVLFSVNENGEVDPTLPAPFKDKSKRHNIPGLEKLATADCVIWMSRFMDLPDEQMQHFYDYFDSGKPLIALRTANHGFARGKKYMVDDKHVELSELLGGAFMGHHGGWHRESTRGIVVEENKSHPILIGVDDIWGPSDVYRCHNEKRPFPEDCTALVLGQPQVDLNPESPANTKKEPLPIAWTKTWTGKQNRPARIFHFTMGSARDFQNAGVRRLTINAVYWGLGLEKRIRPDRSVEPIGAYEPLKSGFNYEKLGVKPRKLDELRDKKTDSTVE